ncbi:uncharacterized protein LOC119725457 [Patiria miniata]|uniref:Uncharacterized protein n=1 Tax=Patiria miniata TaxID=46514 RepID=A0A913ZLW9_PATMI|nr:uncharacterized protein LOC119725457 [Patiria miniata]
MMCLYQASVVFVLCFLVTTAVSSECPIGCSCRGPSEAEFHTAICYNDVKEPTKDLPAAIKTVELRYLPFVSMRRFLKHAPEVTDLIIHDINGDEEKPIPSNLFSGMKHLKALTFHTLKHGVVPKGLAASLHGLNELRFLDLGRNQLECSCELAHWMSQHRVILLGLHSLSASTKCKEAGFTEDVYEADELLDVCRHLNETTAADRTKENAVKEKKDEAKVYKHEGKDFGKVEEIVAKEDLEKEETMEDRLRRLEDLLLRKNAIFNVGIEDKHEDKEEDNDFQEEEDEEDVEEEDVASEDYVKANEVLVKANKGHAEAKEDHVKANEVRVKANEDHVKAHEDHVKSNEVHVKANKDYVKANEVHIKEDPTEKKPRQLKNILQGRNTGKFVVAGGSKLPDSRHAAGTVRPFQWGPKHKTGESPPKEEPKLEEQNTLKPKTTTAQTNTTMSPPLTAATRTTTDARSTQESITTKSPSTSKTPQDSSSITTVPETTQAKYSEYSTETEYVDTGTTKEATPVPSTTPPDMNLMSTQSYPAGKAFPSAGSEKQPIHKTVKHTSSGASKTPRKSFQSTSLGRGIQTEKDIKKGILDGFRLSLLKRLSADGLGSPLDGAVDVKLHPDDPLELQLLMEYVQHISGRHVRIGRPVTNT